MSNSCVKEDENHHGTIKIFNGSSKAVYADFGVGYPDTSSFSPGGLASQPQLYKIKPNEVNESACSLYGTFYENVFRDKRRIPSDTIMIFIMDAELLEAKDIDSSIIQRYDLSLEDLQKVNWRLSYPPDKNMKNIKMYPPYKEE